VSALALRDLDVLAVASSSVIAITGIVASARIRACRLTLVESLQTGISWRDGHDYAGLDSRAVIHGETIFCLVGSLSICSCVVVDLQCTMGVWEVSGDSVDLEPSQHRFKPGASVAAATRSQGVTTATRAIAVTSAHVAKACIVAGVWIDTLFRATCDSILAEVTLP
jgi:hypothetical protein